MTNPNLSLVDWLDDLCVRFIINLPHEELSSVERICFQIEEAQWFYEDFIRPQDPSLPSMNLRIFAMRMFQHCPLSSSFSPQLHLQAYEDFLKYKTRVPVRGAIMLNDDMNQAVLVKGWKKGASWSFPRGKINKNEADLDCAVREVYEETGFDLLGAGLVGAEEDMCKICVSMREQDVMLYVFRGVPMDAHFEARTRKEISDIGWYKLTDLPTIKRKDKTQQGTGHELVRNNKFYMVAPFMGKLKAWIRQQEKLDKETLGARGKAGRRVQSGVTDTEDIDPGDTTADDGPPTEPQHKDDNLANLIANLRRGQQPSDPLPEVSAQQETQQVLDPAAELKKLLSVGGGQPSQTPVEAPGPAQAGNTNGLEALLQANNRPPPPLPPQTPQDHFISPPVQPQSPHRHPVHHQPGQTYMPPPPPFRFEPQRNLPFRGPPPPQFSPQHQSMSMPNPRHFISPPPHQPAPTFPTAHAPNIHQAFNQGALRPYQRIGDPQFAHPPQFPEAHGPAIPPASKLPPPNLTPQQLGLLNAFKSHDRTPTASQPSAQHPQSSQATPRMQQTPAVHPAAGSFASPPPQPTVSPYAPTPPPFQSPPVNPSFQPVQPKPRSAQQESLLSLFRSPSVSAVTPPLPKRVEPVELSAHPTTPGYGGLPPGSQAAGPPKPDLSVKPNLLDVFGAQKPDLTSATVSGPVNAPDFETVKKNTHVIEGNSRGPSPAQRNVPPKAFVPQQILKREPGNAISPVEMAAPNKAANPAPITKAAPRKKMATPAPALGSAPRNKLASPAPAAPPLKILKRPQQNGSPGPASGPGPLPLDPIGVSANQMKTPPAPSAPAQLPTASIPTSAPVATPGFDRRETQQAHQKNALLSLFSKPTAPAQPPVAAAQSPIPPQGLAHPPPGLPSLSSAAPLPTSPVPLSKSPQPPTPRSMVSGIISPISPLPDKGSQLNSPAHLASRSRISSIGDAMPPNIVIPKEDVAPVPLSVQQNGHAAPPAALVPALGGTGLGQREMLSGLDKGKAKATSPADGFLRGFLEDVARRGR